MDSRMLDVAIGLVLVFAIASLIATAIQEIIATYKNTRGHNLKNAVASIGGDDPAFADLIYKHPLVQSLFVSSRGGPSFLPSDVFSTALLSLLADRASTPMRQGTPAEFFASVKPALGDPPGVQNVLTSMKPLLAGVEDDWSAFEARLQTWFEHTGERSIGWFKRITQRNLFIIGLLLAGALNIDAIRIAQSLWNDPLLRERTVALAKQVTDQNSLASLPSVTPSATPTAPPATKSLDRAIQTYSDVTDRQLRLLKDEITLARAAKGAIAPFADKLFVKVSNLASAVKDERAVRAVINSTPSAVEEFQQATDKHFQLLRDEFNVALNNKGIVESDRATISSFSEAVEKAGRTIKEERLPANKLVASDSKGTTKSTVDQSQLAAQNTFSHCTKLSGSELQLCNSLSALEKMTSLGIPLGWANPVSIEQPDPSGFIFMIFGWVITAIAVTLGAPFWFDLLSKLVKIRGTGNQPNESGAGASAASNSRSLTTVSTTVPITQNGEPFSDALNDEEKSLSTQEVESIQTKLGLRNEEINGRLDSNTRAFIKKWQSESRLGETGVLTASQIHNLLYGPQMPGAPSTNSTLESKVYEG